jgi:hypothetical protein
MTWHYGIVKHADRNGDWYGLHEIYVEEGKATMHTNEPVAFVGDIAEEIIVALKMALRDARKYPVMDEITVNRDTLVDMGDETGEDAP